MKVTFPHMGYMCICAKAMLEYLGIEVVVPPPCSKKTLTLGAKHAPEFACMPLKLNLGNFMEAYELGADTIIMAGGCGPCRFGYLKSRAVDEIEKMSFKTRPREVITGSTDLAFQKAITEIDRASTPKELTGAVERAKEIMLNINIDHHRPVLKVEIVGEIYTLL